MINLMYAGNDKTFDGVLISLLATVKYHSGPLKVFILSMDLSEVNPAYEMFSEWHRAVLERQIRKVNPLSSVQVIDAKKVYMETLSDSKNKNSRYTPYTFLRLFCDRFEEIPDKILYFDYDVVPYGDVAALYDIDISEYEFAGAKDYYGRFFINPRYVNAGVLLFNVKMIRETGLFKKCIQMIVKKQMLLPDQSALNKKASKKLVLNRKFNEQHKIRTDTVIRHFSMSIKFFPRFKTQNIKPWDIDNLHAVLNVHEFDDVLEEYKEVLSNAR